MNQFTCLSCRVAFASADDQREHYRTDWHKYNLKRKVVSMPPVTAEDFKERLDAQQEKAQAAKAVRSLRCSSLIPKRKSPKEI